MSQHLLILGAGADRTIGIDFQYGKGGETLRETLLGKIR